MAQAEGLLYRTRLAVARRFIRLLARTPIMRAELLQAICAQLNVREVVAAGRFGLMQGIATDRYIMRDYIDRGTWDAPQVEYLRGLLVDGGTFIDIGANIGMYTVPIAQNARTTCLAFEPEPDNFRLLQVNVARNCPAGNVVCAPIAIAERSGTIEFVLSGDNMGDHRIASLSSAGPTIKVNARRLDEHVGSLQLPRPIIAKVDVQGAELSVLRSFGELIGSVDAMYIEIGPHGIREQGGDPPDLMRILAAAFSLAAFTPTGERFNTSLRPSAEVGASLASFLASDHPAALGDLLLART